jgi:hypothetical protein
MVKNFPEVTGVSGSYYASRNLKAKIDLKKGADWESKKDNPSGLLANCRRN